MRPLYLGMDLGGSNITAAILTAQGEKIALQKIQTQGHEGPEKVVARMAALARSVWQSAGVSPAQISAIGLGVPGVINVNAGMVLYSPNLARWKNIPLRTWLQQQLKRPVVMDNDANVAALGEQWLGAGKNFQHVVMYTLGTGVGGGIIVDGRIFHGSSDGAGELGHMTILPDGPRCNCGNNGCLEAIASGTAIARAGREILRLRPKSLLARHCATPEAVSAKAVFSAAKQGDAECQQVVGKVSDYLGIAVANVINLINPQMIIIGGGVAQAGSQFINRIRQSAKQRAMKDLMRHAKIVGAKLGDQAGVFGAGALAVRMVERPTLAQKGKKA